MKKYNCIIIQHQVLWSCGHTTVEEARECPMTMNFMTIPNASVLSKVLNEGTAQLSVQQTGE